MAFKWLSLTRRGSWTAFRKFVLEERRDIQKRIDVIEAQLDLVGEIKVTYVVNGNGESTQKREKFEVFPVGSSLHKLCRTYIGLGGNPLDISMFLMPKDTRIQEVDDTIFFEKSAMGGVVAPMSGSPDQSTYTGGWYEWDKHPFGKMGRGDIQMTKTQWAVHTVGKSRRWTEKEIRNKRNKIEEKIIKLCDLAEQLEQEKRLLELKMEIPDDSVNVRDTFQMMQSAEYPIAEIDHIFWKEADGEDVPDPSNPTERVLTEDMLQLSRKEIEANRDIAIRTYYPNFMEDTDNEKYPLTSL